MREQLQALAKKYESMQSMFKETLLIEAPKLLAELESILATEPAVVTEDNGETVSVYKHEIYLVRKIVEAASDLKLSSWNKEFRELNGGTVHLQNVLFERVKTHEEWLSNFDQ